MNGAQIKHQDSRIESRSPRDALFFFVLILASVFPILGFGAYFRNEDGRYLAWLRDNNGILQAFNFNVRYHSMTFRPVSDMILRIIYRVAGYDPLAYQLASAACFVGAIVLMYAIGKILFESRRAAFLSILFYFACFYFILHFLYTPIQGFQFPLELLLVAASVYLFLRALPRGRFGYGVMAGGVFAVLAVFNHPVSAFLLPVLGLTLVVVGWRHLSRDGHGREGLAARIAAIIFFVGLWLLIPVVTTQENTGHGGIISAALIILKRYAEYGPIFLRGINRVLIPIPLVYLIVRGRLTPGASPALRFCMGIIASCAGAVLFIVLPTNAAFALLTVLIAAVALTGWTRLLLVLWFFAGMLPNLTSWVVTGVYMRHAAIALSLLLGFGCSEMIGDVAAWMGERTARLKAALTIERVAGTITAIAVLVVLIAALHVVRVPVVSRQLGQIEYLKDLGNNFKDVVAFLSTELDHGSDVYFYRGPTRAEKDQYAYTSAHLERLQPAKCNHYSYYFAISGREDITVRFTDDLPPGASDAVLVATNNWEVRELESTFPLETWREFRRGTAVAKIYRLRGSDPVAQLRMSGGLTLKRAL